MGKTYGKDAKLIYTRNAKGGLGAHILYAPYNVGLYTKERIVHTQVLPAQDVGLPIGELMLKYPCPDEKVAA